MQHEQQDSFDFAEIWRGAQYRRSDDVGPWFKHFVETARAWAVDALPDRGQPRRKASSAARAST
jgi:hypothetical protein